MTRNPSEFPSATLEAAPSGRSRVRWALLSRLALAALTGALLFLPWLEPRLYLLAWVAFVPVLFAVERRGLLEAYLLWMLAGLVWCAGATYWMAEFVANLKEYAPPYNHVAASAFWVFIAQLFGATGLLFQWLRGRGMPDLWLLPVIFIALFSLYPMLFYTRLAEAQTEFLIAIQGVDLVGAHGLDFIIVLTSVLAYRLLRWQKTPVEVWSAAAAAMLLAGWMGYGAWRLHAWDAALAEQPTVMVGVVQPNDPVSIPIPPPRGGFTREYPPEMAATARLAAQGAEFVVWPEARYKGYFQEPNVRAAYTEQIAALGVPLIFHDLLRELRPAGVHSYNAAAYLDERGHLAGTYQKMKVMPFGEYLPPFWQLPGIRYFSHRYLGEFLRPIIPGEQHSVFEAAGVRVLPKICYETSFPEFIAEAVAQSHAQLLVFMSQDNWFGQTRQPFQHLTASVLRGVENRVPVIHAINNGPSAAYLASGRLAGKADEFVEADLLVQVAYSADGGGSFYSLHPRLFTNTVYLALGLLVLGRVAAIVRRWAERRR